MSPQERHERLFQEPTPRQDRRSGRFYRFVRPVLRLHCRLWFGMKVVRDPGAPASLDGAVVVSNHCCLLDSCMVACAIAPTQARFLALAENGEARVYGPIVRALGTIFTGETLGEARFMLHRCQEVLGAGDALVIFPEGNLKFYNKELQPFQDGAFRIALANSAPMVPVVLVQAPEARCLNRLRGKSGFELRIGAPIEPPEGLSRRQQAIWVRDEAQRRMQGTVDAAPAAR